MRHFFEPWPPLRRRRDRGFTLTETLIALTIFAFVLSGLTQGLISTIRANDAARRLARAGVVAESLLENLQGRDAAALGSGRDSVDGRYERRWAVAADTPVAGARTVEIVVEWLDRDGRHALRLPSIITP